MPLKPRSLLDSFVPLYVQETELSTTTRYSAAPSFQHTLNPYVDPFPAARPFRHDLSKC
jgi:hypothetical protein